MLPALAQTCRALRAIYLAHRKILEGIAFRKMALALPEYKEVRALVMVEEMRDNLHRGLSFEEACLERAPLATELEELREKIGEGKLSLETAKSIVKMDHLLREIILLDAAPGLSLLEPPLSGDFSLRLARKIKPLAETLTMRWGTLFPSPPMTEFLDAVAMERYKRKHKEKYKIDREDTLASFVGRGREYRMQYIPQNYMWETLTMEEMLKRCREKVLDSLGLGHNGDLPPANHPKSRQGGC